MSPSEKMQWMDVLRKLDLPQNKHIAKFYSSTEGWANLAYKQHRFHVTHKMPLYEINDIIEEKLKLLQ